LLEINFYINFKTHSIIFINGLNRILQQKIQSACGCGKRYKVLCPDAPLMGMDGIQMGGHMDHLGMVETCHVLVGVMFWGSPCPGIKTHARPPQN
jgi:hypothetical protein